MAINLSFPKPRATQTKIFAVARTDSSTEKCWLPKDAVIVGVYVLQMTAAETAAATFDVGVGADADGILNDFSMATTSVGYTTGGTATGAVVGTKLTVDSKVSCTYTAGSSTAGGTGYVKIEYFVAGGNETITS
jgi:hypothetical protein